MEPPPHRSSICRKHASLTNRTGSKDIGLECGNFDKDQGLLASHVEGGGLPTRNPRRPFGLQHLGHLLGENNSQIAIQFWKQPAPPRRQKGP